MSDMLILFLIIAVALWLHIASNWGYWPMRKCPSGKTHRVVVGTVKNYLGREWCWHKDCMREALQERVHDLEILIDVKSEDLDEANAKVRELQRQNDELTTVAADCRAAAGWGTPNDPMSAQSWAALGDPAEVPTFIRERFQDLQRQVAELEADKAELEADAKRIAFLFSGIRTTSNALVELELRLINGETPSLDAVRSAIDDAMMAALNTETTG